MDRGEEESSPLGGSFGQDNAASKKPRPKGRAQAPPSLSNAGRRRSSGGSDAGFNDSRRFAPSLKEFEDVDSPNHDNNPSRKASSVLHSRSISPNASPRIFRRGSVAGASTGVVGHAVGLGANLVPPSNTTAESSNVRVMVRVRPFGQKEIDEVTSAGGYLQSVIDMPRKDQVLLLDHTNEYTVLQGFNFDEVFWSCTQQKSNVEFADQVKVYEQSGMPALAAAWDGLNSCIFAYGQTGSGKTHTMMGDPSQIANPEGCDEKDLGVIPRLCRDMFNELENKSMTAAQHGLRRTADVRVRFYEIYNEKVRDLLGKVCDGPELRFTYAGTKDITKLNPEDLKIREHPTEGPYVEGISIHQPKSYEDIIALINAGNQERTVGSTNLNDRSSRSHAIFRVTVTQTTFYDQERVGIGGPKTTTHQRRANINLVDLAGSENVKRSGASGSTLIEAQKINLSLTTLRRVIDALIENKSQKNVPYRDSTLTWLLREDLGGNSKTYMLATVSPHHSNAHESHRTLEYAMRARSIVNCVRVNEDETAKMIADLEKKILESAQQMSKGSISEAERIDLEQQMAEAEKARAEIENRLVDAANEALRYKEQLEQEKEKNMAFAFRHALMLRAAKQRLAKAETKHVNESEQLALIKRRIREAGHDNIDDFAQMLNSERSKVDNLIQQKLALQKEKDELELELRDLQEKMKRDEELTVQEKAAFDEANKDAARKDVQYKTQLNVMKQQMRAEMDTMAEANKEKMQKLQAAHDKEVTAILDENQLMADEFQNKVQQLEKEIMELKEKHAKSIRVLEQDHQQQQRYLHADIQRREELIDKLDGELNKETRTRTELQKKVDTFGESSALEKAAALVDQDKAFKEKIAQLKADHDHRIEQLKEIALQADAEAAERTKEKAEIQRYFSGVAKREENYNKAFDLVCHFLDELPDGELPEDWTLEKIKKMIKAFAKFKREYASFRPNRETLKAMLRANPERRGADRIRELLENSPDEVEKEKDSIKVIMGGMKVPEFGNKPTTAPRLLDEPQAGTNGDYSHDHSVAETVPYTTDSLPNASTLAKPTIKTRRSRSSPRVSSASATSPMPDFTESATLSGSMKEKKKTPRTSRPTKTPVTEAKALASSTKRVSTARASTARATQPTTS